MTNGWTMMIWQAFAIVNYLGYTSNKVSPWFRFVQYRSVFIPLGFWNSKMGDFTLTGVRIWRFIFSSWLFILVYFQISVNFISRRKKCFLKPFFLSVILILSFSFYLYVHLFLYFSFFLSFFLFFVFFLSIFLSFFFGILVLNFIVYASNDTDVTFWFLLHALPFKWLINPQKMKTNNFLEKSKDNLWLVLTDLKF